MKRSAPLRRRRGLRRKAALPRPARSARAAASPVRLPISGRRGRRGVDVETRERVIRRDGGCVLARFELFHVCFGELEVHHRKRCSQLGGHDDDNLVTLCSGGHRWVHEHPAVAYAHGLLLRSWEPIVPLREFEP